MSVDLTSSNLKLHVTAPDGIKHLKDLILSLAVCGRLIPQDPNDEPVSEFLNKITSEKERLILEGKISESKPILPINQDEIPIKIPHTWAWKRVGEILNINYGKNLPKGKRNEDGEINVYGSNGIVGHHDISLTTDSCIIIGRKGSSGALNLSLNPSWTTDVAYYTIPPLGINIRYLFFFLNTMNLDKMGKGIKPGLNRNDVYNLPICFPSTTEQSRIVNKVESLFKEIEKLEEQLSQKRRTSIALSTAALDRLAVSDTQSELNTNWNFINENADVITSESLEHVKKLRETILSLAVRGKLVPQYPNDEPVSELLKKIKVDKERLIEEGKIKKPKPLPPISPEDIPHVIPTNWEWVRLGNIAQVKGGKRIPKGYTFSEQETPYIYIRIKDMKNGTIVEDDLVYIDEVVRDSIKPYIIEKKDLYVTIAGTIGQVGNVPPKFHGMNLTENAARIILSLIDKRFIKYAIDSDLIQNQFEKKTTRMAQPKLALKRIRSSIIPFPPFAEQSRIVEKIDKLMSICDDLEEKIKKREEVSEKYAKSLVRNIV